MSRLRCSIYSRFSTDRQSPTSIVTPMKQSAETVQTEPVCTNYLPQRPDRRARLIAF